METRTFLAVLTRDRQFLNLAGSESVVRHRHVDVGATHHLTITRNSTLGTDIWYRDESDDEK
jgi:hypothetical protein